MPNPCVAVIRAPRNSPRINLVQRFQLCTSHPRTHTTPVPTVCRNAEKKRQPHEEPKQCTYRSACSLVFLDRVDALFEELERREEHCIHCTRSTHGHTQASIHVSTEELDFHRWDCLASRVHQAVTLIYTLGRVNRVCESSQ